MRSTPKLLNEASAKWILLGWLAVLFGMAVAFAPCAILRWQEGTWNYIADPDERICYLPTIGHAFTVHPWKLGDTALPEGGSSLYPWGQFVPFILLAKWADAGPLAVLLLWRVWAGASLAGVVFLIGRETLERAVPACLLSILCVADIGLLAGHPLDHAASTGWTLLRGDTQYLQDAWAPFFRQFRLITPGVSWGFFGLFAYCLLRARRQPNRSRIACTAISLGLLFSIYLYFWTTAGAALILLLFIDRNHRRTYFLTGLLGALLGLPAILANARINSTQAEGWLLRMEFFRPIGHTEELLIHKGALIYLVLAGWFVWRRHRDLLPLWALAAAGMILMNHQWITGRQLQNEHFIYAWAAVLTLTVYLVAAREIQLRTGHTTQRILGVAIPLTAGLMAIVFRWEEFKISRPAIQNRAELRAFVADRQHAPPLTPNYVMAGDPAFVDFAAAVEGQRALVGSLFVSHSVSTTEWINRGVLDQVLRGRSPAEAASSADSYYGCNFQVRRRTPADTEREFSRRRILAQAMSERLDEWLLRWDIRYVVVRVGEDTPVSRLRGWRIQYSGSRWTIWERDSTNEKPA